MAQRTVVQLVDDIDGTDLTDVDGETVTFALDGTSYEIDLSAEHAGELRDALATYVAAGRRTGRKGGPGQKATSRGVRTQEGPSSAEIRDWARSNGHEVPDRGRIPQSIRDAFDQR